MINRVIVQVRPQGDGDPGQITEGFYTVEDGYLQMTYRDGRPLENPQYRVAVSETADIKAIAGNLTRSIRRELLGELVPGFSDPIRYPRVGVA